MDRFDWLELERGAPREQAEGHPAREQPHDAASFYRAAQQMRRAGHFGAAAGLYERVIGFDDHHHPAWVEMIDSLVRAKQATAAFTKSWEAINSYRQVRVFYASRALALAHRDQFDEAFSLSDISIEGEDRSWYAYCVRAELVLKVNPDDRGEAHGLLAQALDMADALWEPYFLGGWMMFEAGVPAVAAGYFAEAAHFNPRAPVTWLCLGDSFRALKLYDQAMFYYQRVIELEPTHETALERQKQCGGFIYGLMRPFHRDTLRSRWNKEFEKLIERWEPDINDF